LTVTATVKDVPALPVIAGTTPVVEGNNYVYSIDLVSDATSYTWTWPGPPGAWSYLSGQDTNSLTVTAGSQGGDITVIVTNSCGESDLASYTVTIGVAPECPTSTNIVNPDPQTVCEDVATSQLTANINGAGSYTPLYQWYYNTSTNTKDPNHADANLIAGATSAGYTPLSTVSEIGTRYYFCVGYATDAGCTQTNDDQTLASTPVIITVNATPSAPTGSASQSFCSADNPTVADLTASGTSIKWYDASTGGSLLAGSTSLVSGNHYYATQTVSGCESDTRFDVTVTISDPPSVADAGPDQNITVDTATMDGEPPTTGTGMWNLISGSGTPTSPTSPTSVITGLSNGANVFRWTISNPPCNDYWSEVTITTTYVPSSPPTITLTDPNPLVVQGGNSTNLIYIATTNNPDKYSITYDATALGQGFENVPITTDLPVSPIALSVPPAALLGTYNGILTVKNSSTGLTSGNYPITIIVTNITNHSLYNCTSCHITHNAPGSTLTAVAGNALLCQSCHTSTGAASAKPLVNGDKGVSSHSWDVLTQNDDKEVLPPLNSSMQLRIVDNKIICSTCHNQHENSVGSPYLRIDNTDDLLCKDCHRKRDKGLYSTDNVNNRGSHPVGVTYDDTDPRFNNTQTLVTNGNKVQCSTCHGVHDIQTPSVNNLTTDGNLLRMTNDVNLCTDCHNYSDHMGMTCLDCHEVHNTVDGTVDNNIFMIKGLISTPLSGNKPVVFTAEGGPTGSFAGIVDGSYTGICEVCHDSSYEIAHFNNDGEGSDQIHTSQEGNIPESNCTTCHSHSDGFIPSGGSCHGCHDATPGAFKYPLASEGYTEGAHPLHVGTYEFTCDTCHYLRGSGGANEGSHPSGSKDIVFNPSGLSSANGSSPSWDGASCSNVYCHSDGGASDGSTITYVQTPNWIGGSVSCGDCHAVPSTNGAHTTHTSAPYNFACTTCHVGINGTTDPPTANHVNGTLGPEEFDPGGMATANGATPNWNVSTLTCSSVYCHSDGNGTFQSNTPDWYSGTIACGDCHTVTPTSGAHARHTTEAQISGGSPYNFPCSTCHNGAIVPSSPPTNGHINGTIGPPEFDLSGLATRNGNDANTPVFNANRTCSNVFCHSHGQSAEGTSTGNTQRDGITPLGITWEIAGTVPRTPPALPTFVTTPVWDTGTLPTCGGCHLGSLTPTSSTTDWPQSGQHTGKGAHLVTCWWCHNTIGDQTYIGTYGTDEHVDGDVWFIPELFSDGGTFHNLPVPTGGDGNTASSGHCGDPGGGGKTCWY
jgi:predicted CxxxxCH...CXXCH cytochrome family protein